MTRLSRLQRLTLEEIARSVNGSRGAPMTPRDDRGMINGVRSAFGRTQLPDAYFDVLYDWRRTGLEHDWILTIELCRAVYKRYTRDQPARSARWRGTRYTQNGAAVQHQARHKTVPTAAFRSSFSRLLTALCERGLIERRRKEPPLPGHPRGSAWRIVEHLASRPDAPRQKDAVRPTLTFTVFVAQHGIVAGDDYDHDDDVRLPCGDVPPGRWEYGRWLWSGRSFRWEAALWKDDRELYPLRRWVQLSWSDWRQTWGSAPDDK